jgi:hypothetical protein
MLFRPMFTPRARFVRLKGRSIFHADRAPIISCEIKLLARATRSVRGAARSPALALAATMALQFSAFSNLIARDVCRRLPAARHEPPNDPNGPARLNVPGAVATTIRDRAYWRATFERVGQAVTMSGLSGERSD